MSLRLIVVLSLFGLAMAIATVYVLAPEYETFFWVAIFIADAWLIARFASRRFFLHGFLVGVLSWGWVALAHVFLWDAYARGHASGIATMREMAVPHAPRIVQQIFEALRRFDLPMPGLSGAVIGAFAWVAAKIVRRAPAGAPSGPRE